MHGAQAAEWRPVPLLLGAFGTARLETESDTESSPTSIHRGRSHQLLAREANQGSMAAVTTLVLFQTYYDKTDLVPDLPKPQHDLRRENPTHLLMQIWLRKRPRLSRIKP